MYSRKNILHIINNFDNFYYNFFENLDKSLHHRAFYFREKERGPSNIKGDYIDERLNYSKYDKIFFRNRSKKILKDAEKIYALEEYSLTHAHTLFTNGHIAYLINKKFGIPYIVSVRATDIDQFFTKRKDLYFLGCKILKNANKIIFISPSNKNKLLQKLSGRMKTIVEKKSLVIPNGVTPLFINNKFKKQKKINNKIEVITVGYIGKRKNQLLVSKAVEKLVKEGVNINYTVIGKVLDKKIFNELMLNPNIQYFPFMDQNKLINIYRKADIYIMPSKSETFGITYLEAMTQSLPVIYSENNGLYGYYDEGVIGYSTKDNVDDLVKKIHAVIANIDILSKNSFYESDKFKWKNIQKKYDKIYIEESL